jgi:LysM repeat protein
MMRIIAAVGLMILTGFSVASAQSLRGSRSAMVRQNSIAQKQDLTFLRTSSDVRRFIENGRLVALRGNANYHVADISFPYARPSVKVFVERLSDQYRSACGEKLVVTSLTRPLSRQPRNAHELSVHPTGMAVDLRVSRKSSCRRWLESTLKDLERERVLDATRERRPAHYHVAVYPEAYTRHVASLTASAKATAAAREAKETKVAEAQRPPALKIAVVDPGPLHASLLPIPAASAQKVIPESYIVRAGDSLWDIARRFGTTVDALKHANQLAKPRRLQPGQKLVIPSATMVVADEPPSL